MTLFFQNKVLIRRKHNAESDLLPVEQVFVFFLPEVWPDIHKNLEEEPFCEGLSGQN